MNARLNSSRGQATVLTLVFLAVLLGMAALVLDIGSWYRADRNTQSTADSAALASPLRKIVGPDGEESVLAEAERVLEGRLPFFGRLSLDCGFPPRWFQPVRRGHPTIPQKREMCLNP